MEAFLVLVGTELLNGMMVDTNSIFIAEELNKYGVKINGKLIVGDEIENIVKALKFATDNSNLVIVSGGLGPTIDDLTRDAVSKFLGKKLIYNEEEFKKMVAKYVNTSVKLISENNKRQVMFPEGAIILDNEKGSAPAFFVENIACFPGVPIELKSTFKKFLEFYFKDKDIKKIYIKDILFYGIPESKLEEELKPITKKIGNNIFIEFLVKDYGIIFRLLTFEENIEIVNNIKAEIYKLLPDYVFGEDGDRIEEIVFKKLKDKGYKISLAESCTGGMISSKLVEISGISEVFKEGLITYSNDSKVYRLGISEEILNKFGAVSFETVNAMLDGLKTEVGIAVSGIAGPNGGTSEKPVGTVFIGIKVLNERKIEKFIFRGDRNQIRYRATMTALNMLRKML